MSKESYQPRVLRILDDEHIEGFGVNTAYRMFRESPTGSKILADGLYREEIIEQAAELVNLDSQFSNNLVYLPDFGPYPVVMASSYESIRFLLKSKLNRFVLQSMLAPKIGHVLTSEGDDWKQAYDLTINHTRPGKNHTLIAERDIAATFDRFMPELTSDEGLSATTLTVEMIHEIMTDTVFGGYHDENEGTDGYEGVSSWKEDIVYFLKKLNDVQLPYGIGVMVESLPGKFSEKIPSRLKRIVLQNQKVSEVLERKLNVESTRMARKLMRVIAKQQGNSDVLERMLHIEDTLFPRINNWIEAQEKKNLTEEQLNKMGFLGTVLKAHKEGRPMKITRPDIFGIYTAALDSTANAANWLISEFAQHPDILRKVASLKGDERKEYIQFIQFELWRKDPITPIIFRQVPPGESRTMPDGTVMPPGTLVLLSVGGAGLNSDRFPDPKVFNPDRYYEMTPKQIDQVRQDMYLVFAAGDKHRCQGEGAVYLTLNALINHMADRFESINIVPRKNGEKVNPVSNRSGVRSPVDQYGDELKYQVVLK